MRVLICLLIFVFSQSIGRNDADLLRLLSMLETRLSAAASHPDSSCPTPPKVENGYFYCEGDECFLECDLGHVGDGRTTTHCHEGSWAPAMHEMTCSKAFILITGGLMNSSTVEVYGKGFHKRLPNMPKPRMGHAVENVDSHMILCGGVPMEFTVYFPVPSAIKQCIEMDQTDFTWKEYPYTHEGRDIHASINIHGTIFWFGGHNSPSTMEYNTPEGPHKDKWFMENNFGVAKDPHYFKHACAAKISPTEILVTGGYYDAKLTLKYNVVTKELTRMEDMNLCRSGHGCNYIKDDELGIEGVIVGGGYPLCNAEELNEHVSFALTSSSEFYDLKTGKWKQVGDMNKEKRGMRMIYAVGGIHAFGGLSRIIDDDPTNNIQLNEDGFGNLKAFAFDDRAEVYDPKTETWSWSEDKMLFRRNFMGLGLISERRFYFGCLAPTEVAHGTWNCPTYPEKNPEKECTLECHDGYTADGETVSKCTEGSWAPALHTMTCSSKLEYSDADMIEEVLARYLESRLEQKLKGHY